MELIIEQSDDEGQVICDLRSFRKWAFGPGIPEELYPSVLKALIETSPQGVIREYASQLLEQLDKQQAENIGD